MDITSLSRGWWGFHPFPPIRRSIVEHIRDGVLDADLAALLWLLVEGRVPVVVAAEGPRIGKTTLATALLDFVPAGSEPVEVAGAAESFGWLPDAGRLGWRGADDDRGPMTGGGRREVTPSTGLLLVAELSDHTPAYTWGDHARVVIRALSLGYAMAATIHAGSLEDVFASLRRPPVGLTDDELSHLGVVVVLGAAESARRVLAAHYVRPVARDEHGHVQRLGPAVLATWDARRDAFEHFGWGITPELALRVGRRAGDFEIEHERRRDYLDGLARANVVAPDEVRHALAGYFLGPVPVPPS